MYASIVVTQYTQPKPRFSAWPTQVYTVALTHNFTLTMMH